MDDARKLKSIRPPSGHFGAIWFEEADEFSDRAELDSLLQSLLRGGEGSAVFYSFNPPKNPAHWIYGVLAEQREDTLVTESCWTDLPGVWLGQNFVAEALQQKKLHPEKYEQEYLGKPSLEEGAVFRNLTLGPLSPLKRTPAGAFTGWISATGPIRFIMSAVFWTAGKSGCLSCRNSGATGYLSSGPPGKSPRGIRKERGWSATARNPAASPF